MTSNLKRNFEYLVQYIQPHLRPKSSHSISLGYLSKEKISQEEMQIIRATQKLARTKYMTLYCIPRAWLIPFHEFLNNRSYRFPKLDYSQTPIRLAIRSGKKSVHKSAVVRHHNTTRIRETFIDIIKALYVNEKHHYLPKQAIDVVIDSYNGGCVNLPPETLFYDMQRLWLTAMNTYENQKPPNLKLLLHDHGTVVSLGSDNVPLYRKLDS
ncbi:hypothetical protein POMI540_2799 [Schizosaccharomyces pombe]|uniref:Uncharacterized protein C30C2.03 n=1 Tax=Schizosaccharomyces pombe (strain 972 / ATCC 24843) TaxID=284812 RepID=YLF3_SCHPO|nr:uncharacterized protein SPAC30C2.03 [Schizosaccharomyces pombe]Q9P6K8.1 RecName: Full=Uncharacterized protein C30C2.03 [Schizosaccharomyces pombe 972h-]CAB90790.1 sequence orphan [Schizosaccharomyces pombe]|eukprot:NP_594655.1 uncharacterized protein SPAC30C2.03 [Schizosaccharomyces pombe]